MKLCTKCGVNYSRKHVWNDRRLLFAVMFYTKLRGLMVLHQRTQLMRNRCDEKKEREKRNCFCGVAKLRENWSDSSACLRDRWLRLAARSCSNAFPSSVSNVRRYEEVPVWAIKEDISVKSLAHKESSMAPRFICFNLIWSGRNRTNNIIIALWNI